MNRRAITPIIAVVLLLMMTVAAAGAAYFWITTIQSRIQGQIGTQVSESTATSSKLINIISAVCANGSPSAINVTIQNTGTTSIPAGSVALTIADDQSRNLGTNVTELLSPITSNSITTLRFYISAALTSGSTYGIKITVPGGSEQTTDCVP